MQEVNLCIRPGSTAGSHVQDYIKHALMVTTSGLLTGLSKGAFLPPSAQMLVPGRLESFQNPSWGVLTASTVWSSTPILVSHKK